MEYPPDVKTVQKVVLEWIDVLLRRSGVDPSRIDGADQWVAFFLIVLLALALDAVLRFVLLRGVKRLVLRTRPSGTTCCSATASCGA